MKKLIIDRSLIPYGYYCTGCPYYHFRKEIYDYEYGCPSMTGRGIAFCDLLGEDDNMLDKRGYMSLLWDGCKQCSVRYDDPNDKTLENMWPDDTDEL